MPLQRPTRGHESSVRDRCELPPKRVAIRCIAIVACLLCQPTLAYERDVHYGLTHWLALKAGFEPGQADTIALGNERVDGGLMDTLAMSPEFACTAPSHAIALRQQQHHFPSIVAVPAPPPERVVVPGDAAARTTLRSLGAMPSEKALLLLAKFGEALHSLQDSWAHRGAPGGAGSWGRYLVCDENLLSFHGASRGASETHEADLTWRNPEDLVEAARATYDVLRDYPTLLGKSRSPKPFDQLETSVRSFAAARTKSAKRRWLLDQGYAETGFLSGISLPDGPTPFLGTWRGSRLPQLASDRSLQHEIDPTARAFFDSALAEWLSGSDLDALAARLAGRSAAPPLALRLKLWLVRDHGRASPFLHATRPLEGTRLQRARALTGDPRSLVRTTVAEALIPLQAIAAYPTPLLPYVASVRTDASGTVRAIALLRLVHAPYDTVGLVAERRANVWTLVDVIGTPDH